MNTSDELIYLFQSQIFSSGRLFAESPPIPTIFSATWMIELEDKWTGQYPPGWPVILAAASLAGLPDWSVGPLLGLFSIFLLYYLCSIQYSRSIAVITCLVYSTSVFFIFNNAASFLSHIPFVVSSLLYAIFIVQFTKTGKLRYLVFAGVAFSAALSIRYYPAALMAIPLAYYLYKWRSLRAGTACFIAGALPIVLGILTYHLLVFGSPFTTGYKADPDLPGIKFSLDIIDGIYLSLIRLWELGNWTSPVLGLMYLVAMIHRIRSRTLSFTDMLFPVLLIGMAFFPYTGGQRYGPRYFFDAYPFFVASAVSGVFEFARHRSRFTRALASHSVLVSVVYSLCILPFVASFYQKLAWEHTELFHLVEGAELRNAVVIVHADGGRTLPLRSPSLIRNDPDLANEVLYVQPTDVELLTAVFPSRTIWAFERDGADDSPGQLKQLR